MKEKIISSVSDWILILILFMVMAFILININSGLLRESEQHKLLNDRIDIIDRRINARIDNLERKDCDTVNMGSWTDEADQGNIKLEKLDVDYVDLPDYLSILEPVEKTK